MAFEYSVKAHPTVYNGVRFRSRLEARWACVFDLLGWRWTYEPIDLNGWVPDFGLMGASGRYCLVEVKPEISCSTKVMSKALSEIFCIDADFMFCGLWEPHPCPEYARMFPSWTDTLSVNTLTRRDIEADRVDGKTKERTVFYHEINDLFDFVPLGKPYLGHFTGDVVGYGVGGWQPTTEDVFQLMWREAGNRTQWRKP